MSDLAQEAVATDLESPPATEAPANETPAGEAPADTKPEGPQTADGYKFILPSDLDASLEEPQPPVEEKVEKDKPETPAPEQAPEEALAETPAEEPVAPKEDKPPEPQAEPIKIGENTYPDIQAVGRTLEDGQRLIGRQGEELGALRKQLAELTKANEPDPNPEPEYDQFDPRKWTEWKIQEELRAKDATDTKTRQKHVRNIVEAENRKFVKDNPKMTVEKMQEVAAIRAEHGCSYDDALGKWDKAKGTQTQPSPNGSEAAAPAESPAAPAATTPPAEAPDVEAVKKQEAAQAVQPTLSGGGGGGSTGVDISSMNKDEFHAYLKTLSPAEHQRVMSGGDP